VRSSALFLTMVLLGLGVKMKRLLVLAIVLLCFATQVLAVDVTLTFTAGQVTRFAAALGKARSLVDVNGNPRVATAVEMKQFVIDNVRGMVYSIEYPAAVKAATDAVAQPTGMDPT
jgi:hypothetical protein